MIPDRLLVEWPALDRMNEHLDSGNVVRAAATLAGIVHAGQMDMLGGDYGEQHLRAVAESVGPFGVYAEAVGWLHGILTRTTVTVEDLRRMGFPGPVVDAVDVVTPRAGETPTVYARRVGHGPVLGLLVALADNARMLRRAAVHTIGPLMNARTILTAAVYRPATSECPQQCDPDCEAGPWHCENVHVPSHKRTHTPGECPARNILITRIDEPASTT